jgi:hypothetical protein
MACGKDGETLGNQHNVKQPLPPRRMLQLHPSHDYETLHRIWHKHYGIMASWMDFSMWHFRQSYLRFYPTAFGVAI